MVQNKDNILSIWLFTVCSIMLVLMTFGGFVRLTRSGLSMVEWHVITGVIPPMDDSAWQIAFDKYQQTPEYQKINKDMTLAAYKSIYYKEYIHRVLARFTGLIYVIPLFLFLITRTIPWKKSWVYLGIGLLFALQGFMGWYMVKSGLVDNPHVSHYRLTAHLLLALTLLSLCFWLALSWTFRVEKNKQLPRPYGYGVLIKVALGLVVVIVSQIAYGGLMAGLKAGHVSSTFPLILGYLIPPGLLSTLQPWPLNLVENAVTIHFIHRWLGFIVLIFCGMLYYGVRKQRCSSVIKMSTVALITLVEVQIVLGLGVIWEYALPLLALIHQGVALLVFLVVLFINHRLWGATWAAG